MNESKLNRTIFQGDNLEVLRGINSGSIDLVYLDPPFNSKKQWNAPIGSKAAGASFKDTWSRRDIDLQWEGQLREHNPAILDVIKAGQVAGGNPTGNYLLMMAPRLVELHRVLKPTGSIYLHCDPTESHSLKLMMDTIFGRAAFRNEIVWKRTAGRGDAHRFGRVHDVVLYYAGEGATWNTQYLPLDDDYIAKNFKQEDNRGKFSIIHLTAPGASKGMSGDMWRDIDPGKVGRHWSSPTKGNMAKWITENVLQDWPGAYPTPQDKLDALDKAGLIYWPPTGRMPRLKFYLDASPGAAVTDLFADIPPVAHSSNEKVGYPTQKPLALVERIIQASSNQGDVVLDPFCGCATTPIAAERLERQWIGIDYSEKAYELVQGRLHDQLGLPSSLAHLRTRIPERTDLGVLPSYKTHKPYLYGIQGGHCALCQTHLQVEHLTIDHIVPRSKGGTDHQDNLQLLCLPCNSRKGNRRWEQVKKEYWQERERRQR